METLKLGEIIEPGEAVARDCIHVAVAPVVAGQLLSPGERVGFLDDGRVGICGNNIGIADPFLADDVQPGERFWIFLYPGTITGLRHMWSHEAFKGRTTEAK